MLRIIVEGGLLLTRPSAMTHHRPRTPTVLVTHYTILTMPSNLRWADVESLLVHYGAEVREGKGSAISIQLHGRHAYFHRPHHGDKADKGAIESALKFLRETGSID